FFSSGRRHTRSDRDWSSDVCSSDLGRTAGCAGGSGPGSATNLYARYNPTAQKHPAQCADPHGTGGGRRLSGGFRRGRLARETVRSEEHTSELQSRSDLVCRLLLEKK